MAKASSCVGSGTAQLLHKAAAPQSLNARRYRLTKSSWCVSSVLITPILPQYPQKRKSQIEPMAVGRKSTTRFLHCGNPHRRRYGRRTPFWRRVSRMLPPHARNYATFYVASALLLAEGKTFRNHRGVVALIHRDYVKSGRLPVDMGRSLSTLSDLRSVGDYGGTAHRSHVETNVARHEAEQFLAAVCRLLPPEVAGVACNRTANPEN